MRVAIIGGGLSGSLIAMNLIKQTSDALQIFLFEKNPVQLNKGVAYSSQLPYQLLNVSVGEMSLFSDKPAHFYEWLKENKYAYHYNDFAPRDIYGKYIAETFARETANKKGSELKIVLSEVTKVAKNEGCYKITYDKDEIIEADKVILCTGNFPPGDVPGLNADIKNSAVYIAHPWGGFNINAIPSENDVLMVGSGLTMIDLVLSLAKHNHKGKIIVISRRGMLPLPHGNAPDYSLSYAPDLNNATVASLLKWVKQQMSNAAENGKNWRSVVNAIRGYLPAMWAAMPLEEKKRFLRHVRPFWEIHRHRIPEESINILNDLQNRGQLDLLAGRIQHAELAGNKAKITYRCRNSSELKSVSIDTIINCTGPETEYRKLRSELYRNLIENKLARPDALSLGLDADKNGFVIDAEGKVNKNIVLIGPPAKGALWECTALREIREQAVSISGAILKTTLL